MKNVFLESFIFYQNFFRKQILNWSSYEISKAINLLYYLNLYKKNNFLRSNNTESFPRPKRPSPRIINKQSSGTQHNKLQHPPKHNIHQIYTTQIKFVVYSLIGFGIAGVLCGTRHMRVPIWYWRVAANSDAWRFASTSSSQNQWR